MFPSPYGVSFILILIDILMNRFDARRFPSPYGVSFILISFAKLLSRSNGIVSVSVSLWSIIHSYS